MSSEQTDILKARVADCLTGIFRTVDFYIHKRHPELEIGKAEYISLFIEEIEEALIYMNFPNAEQVVANLKNADAYDLIVAALLQKDS